MYFLFKDINRCWKLLETDTSINEVPLCQKWMMGFLLLESNLQVNHIYNKKKMQILFLQLTIKWNVFNKSPWLWGQDIRQWGLNSDGIFT